MTTAQSTCGQDHRFTVEDEAQQKVLYAGTDREDAIGALVSLRLKGECGHVTAGHPEGGAAYCSETSCLLEDEAIKAWDEQDRECALGAS